MDRQPKKATIHSASAQEALEETKRIKTDPSPVRANSFISSDVWWSIELSR